MSILKRRGPNIEPCGTPYLISEYKNYKYCLLLPERQLKMKQSDGWSKPYAARFAINKSCLRQSSAFDKSVGSIPPTPLLSKLFFNFSAIRRRLC